MKVSLSCWSYNSGVVTSELEQYSTMRSLLLVLVVIYTTGISTAVTSSIDNTAIVNLTTAINQLLTQSTTISESRSTLTDLMQLVLTKQLLSANSCPTSTTTADNGSDLQDQISKMNTKIDFLIEAMQNLTARSVTEGDTSNSNLLHSCEEILTKWPSSSSGYYLIADVNGHVRHVYCHMESLCGKGGGWRRVAHLNMTDSNEKCPEQFRLYSQKGVRACGNPTMGAGCNGIKFSLDDFEYSEVCGKVIGYQLGSPDGFYTNSIDTYYVDGISLTHGSNPRKHIWTFASGYQDKYNNNRCPCGSNPTTPPSFVSSHYYCESGCHDSHVTDGKLYTTEHIWDGKGCGSHETTCCQRTLIPWFYRSLSYSTTDYIEMRICMNEGTSNEDTPVEQYEIYVR